MIINVTVLIIIFFTGTTVAFSQSLEDEAIALSEAAIGNVLPPLSFIDTQGRKVAISQFQGKPVLVSLVYTGCADVCPAIIQNLHPAIDIAQEALGKNSFTTITVGFDTRHDSPERMRSFAKSQGVDLPNWHFLSGDQETVDKLADAVGFKIVPSAGGFDHMAQISVIDGNGLIYQQVLGGVFSPPAIVEPLKNLLFDQRNSILSVKGLAERVKLFCTVYNSNTGRYYFNYSLFIGGVIGLACLSLVFFWLLREFKISSRNPERSSHL
ncbi:MAG: SCO family protein [Methyloligellaceae bacterium]